MGPRILNTEDGPIDMDDYSDEYGDYLPEFKNEPPPMEDEGLDRQYEESFDDSFDNGEY